MAQRSADCVFCGIVAGTIPSAQVRETDRTLAFRDVSPQAPVHVLVVPKDHYADVAEVVAAAPHLLRLLLEECVAVARDEGIADDGYRIALNTGEQGGQGVAHCHAHVLGGRQMAGQLG
ncbi:HIT domain-containing protein [Actinopolymorpha sp. B17G11]|uniref:HIT domain-containing protein n=1 Tax=Actinopolymorpha sp. B17G11 TaxID=3160861 RepID=UPI0032E4E7D3